MSDMDSRNLAHVREIAQKIDNISAGLVYYCEDCGEEITIPQDGELEADTCPHCGGQLTQMDFHKYFEDCLDIEYRTRFSLVKKKIKFSEKFNQLSSQKRTLHINADHTNPHNRH